jgi:hypothetical protein
MIFLPKASTVVLTLPFAVKGMHVCAQVCVCVCVWGGVGWPASSVKPGVKETGYIYIKILNLEQAI